MTLHRVLPATVARPLHDVAASRALEAAALAAAPPHALMRLAGRAVARLALAVAPHARSVWIAAGPGNNGGDGLEAALHLRAAGRAVTVWLCADPARLPPDAAASLQRAREADVELRFPPCPPPGHDAPDLAIDALLGLGRARRPSAGDLGAWLEWLAAPPCPVLAVDLPSGLDADTGRAGDLPVVRADHTLALLTLKPGLFTADGRDHAGTVWFDDLLTDAASPGGPDGVGATTVVTDPCAWLAGPPSPRAARAHAGHKGSFGDVAVVGGAPGMGGAALLAARAALAAGAGRVWWVPLDPSTPRVDALRPELMGRTLDELSDATLHTATLACGCGGGDAVGATLPRLLQHVPRLVLDADALNAIAMDGALSTLVRARATRGQATVLTPHPLEAARLLGVAAADVQADRLPAARRLSDALACTVVLKGSGTVVASPGSMPSINPTGNAALATGGTGDVLAGWLAGRWSVDRNTWAARRFVEGHGADLATDAAPSPQAVAHRAAIAAVWAHGRAAERATTEVLRAGDLVEALAAGLRPDGAG